MRTMKKVIALSLVLAMALSMMATAAFKDQEAINEDLTGDISLMVALNVFSEQGTGAGYFEPNRELTREEVAKLIYVLKNKGVDNGATSWTGMNIFKDIEAGRWSEGYINYAASVGMMAGTGEGYFNPTAKMSAVEVAKLLLVLNGYKADVQGYLGTNWDVNIIRDAEAAGIFANYDLPVRGSVTREWVARLMNNGIAVTKVKYEDGQAVEMYNQNNEPQTFANQDLGLKETTGILIATANAKLVNGTGSVANGGKANCEIDTDGDGVAEATFKYDAPLNLLGQTVTVLSKGALNTTNKVYGVTTHKDNIVTTTVMKDVDYDADDFENDFTMYVDYKVDGTFDESADFGGNDGRTVTLIDYDNDGKYDAGFVSSVQYAEVSYINPSNNTINFTTNKTSGTVNGYTGDDYKDLNFIDTVSKNDVVKLTKTYATGEEVINVERVDVVTGAITKVSGSTATIDGNEYKKSDNSIGSFTLTVKKEAKNYYIDGGYVVFTNNISDDDDLPTNFAYVVAKTDGSTDEWGKDNKKVDILKNDGTREVLDYDDTVEGDVGFSAVDVGTVYEYVMKDGDVYLKAISDTTSGSGFKFDKSENTFVKGTTKYPVNSDTVFFVVNGDDYAVMKASEIKGDIDAANENFLANSTGLPYVYYAVLSGDATGESSDGVAVSANSYSTELDEDNNTVYKIVVTKLDGTEVTLVSDTESYIKGFTNMFVEYSVGTNGKLDKSLAKCDNYKNAAVTVVDGKAVMLDSDGDLSTAANPGYMTLADDVKIYYVDAYKSSNSDVNNRIIVSEGDGVVVSAETAENRFAKSVLYKVDKDDASIITEIIVEIHGEEILSTSFNPAA